MRSGRAQGPRGDTGDGQWEAAPQEGGGAFPRSSFPWFPPHVRGHCAGRAGGPTASFAFPLLSPPAPMAACPEFRAEDDFLKYDSTWEDDEEEDDEDGGGDGDDDEGGEPEGAEAAAAADSEPGDAGEQLVRGSQQQVGGCGGPSGHGAASEVGGSPFPARPELLGLPPAPAPGPLPAVLRQFRIEQPQRYRQRRRCPRGVSDTPSVMDRSLQADCFVSVFEPLLYLHLSSGTGVA